ncbi:MAG: SCP2 sterol-binding domain-containing protein [Anaerolineales bacterium]|nr:SCP2 sterol-binding domain-containing protein [Anaerolineales bacterium]
MAYANSIHEVFDAMPARFQATPNDLNAVVQFDVTGEGGGQYAATFGGGTCAVTAGQAPNPTLTFTASASDFLGMINGEINPMQAFMQGRIRLGGDISLALKLQSIFMTG